ncbi:S-adenosyl-L-methionine-dependent methyltransferase [Ceratobasidium sp. AG-I]|nr:S-adenosyl-L-methionine-dependent methyltransferase [Ceratobasidium sp. AG-I]
MDVIPKHNKTYESKQYWEDRYQTEEEPFDWFKSYRDIQDLLGAYIPGRNARILMLGCGNSSLSKDMYQDGYHEIVNIDFSSVVIERMREIQPYMQWIEMDIRDLKFEDESFDILIDKGTMDAMLTGTTDVWNPAPEVVQNCEKEVAEAVRVLRPGGKLIYLTFGQPHFRRRYLTLPGCSLEVKELGESFHYYLYVMTKDK